MTKARGSQDSIAVGAPVYTPEGNQLGTVKEVRGQFFKVDARMQPDYWLRTDTVRSASAGQVMLAFGQGELGRYQVSNPDDYDTSQGAMAEYKAEDASVGGHAHTETAHAGHQAQDQRTMQLREEQLRVNKEREQAGTVEVGKRVTEHTATAQVPLREERVVIERQPVSGQVPARDAGFREGQSIEVPLERERATVDKQAVVTEEVGIRKEAGQRTEQVQDTVRKEELEVRGDGNVVTEGGRTHTPADREHHPR